MSVASFGVYARLIRSLVLFRKYKKSEPALQHCMYTKVVKKIHYCHINVCDYPPPFQSVVNAVFNKVLKCVYACDEFQLVTIRPFGVWHSLFS